MGIRHTSESGREDMQFYVCTEKQKIKFISHPEKCPFGLLFHSCFSIFYATFHAKIFKYEVKEKSWFGFFHTQI